MPAIDSFFIQLGFDDAGAEKALSRIELLLTSLNIAVGATNDLLHNMAGNFREVNNEVNNVDNSVHNVNNTFNTVNNTITRTTSNGISLFRSLRNEALLFGGVLGSIGGLGVLLGNRYGQQAGLGRASENIGLDPITLKAWQNAGEQLGIKPEATLQALSQAELSAEAFKKGDFKSVAEYQNASDVKGFFGKGGAPGDFESGLTLLARKNQIISRIFEQSPRYAQEVANAQGVGEIFNLIKLQPEEFNARIEAAKRKALLGKGEITDAQRAAEAWKGLSQEIESVTNKITIKLAPAFTDLISVIELALNKLKPQDYVAHGVDMFAEGFKDILVGGIKEGGVFGMHKYLFKQFVEEEGKYFSNMGSYMAGNAQKVYGDYSAITGDLYEGTYGALGNIVKKWLKGTKGIDSSETQSAKKEMLMQLMGEYGLDAPHAQALLATMWRESQFNTGIDSATGKYKGLIQWSPRRRQDYYDWSGGKKLEEQDRHEQIRFLMHEATTKGLEKANWDAFMAETDPVAMQRVLIQRFIRPQNQKEDLQKDLEYKRLLFNLDKKQTSTSSMKQTSKTEVSIGDVIFNGVKDATGMQGVLDKYFSQNNLFPQFNSGQR